MSSGAPHEPAHESDELQFDEAELPSSAASDTHAECSTCHSEIHDAYYTVNGSVVCENCRHGLEHAWYGGSRIARLIKALALGSGAALIGALIYYLIFRFTGYNIGLVAILVGYMVGRGVNMGSGNRGGLGYQFLSLFLTYAAISLMLLPIAIEEFVKNPPPDDPAGVAAAVGPDGKVVPEAEAPKAAEANAAGGPAQKPFDAGGFAAALGVLIGFAVAMSFALPVAVAIQSPMSGLIFAFGLFQAWSLNQRRVLAFAGPFQVGAGPTHPEDEDHAV